MRLQMGVVEFCSIEPPRRRSSPGDQTALLVIFAAGVLGTLAAYAGLRWLL